MTLSAGGRAARTAPRPGRLVLPLLVTAVALGACTAVLGHDAGLLALALGTVALAAAAVVQLRAQWITVSRSEPTEVPAPARDDLPAADATAEQLRRLRDQYVSAVNSALDEGDSERARELADGYPDEALRVITGAAR